MLETLPPRGTTSSAAAVEEAQDKIFLLAAAGILFEVENVEKIERTEFVVLTGHLDEQPLPELIRRLRVQRKTGRLQVEYADAPGAFFFEEGQLVDARLGALRGVEALYAALELGGASFNFNPLVRPPERSIDRQGQKFIRDLVEGPRRNNLAEVAAVKVTRDLEAPSASPSSNTPAPLQLGPVAELMAPLEQRLIAVEDAIISTSRRFTRERMVYAVVIGFLAGLSLVAALNVVFDPFGTYTPAASTPPAATVADDRQQPASTANTQASSTSQPTTTAPTPATEQPQPANEQEPPPVPASAAVIGTRRADELPTSRREYVVQVLVEVKDGRVTNARVWNPRPGAERYEAVALKMARERRYPETFNGSERLRISVKP